MIQSIEASSFILSSRHKEPGDLHAADYSHLDARDGAGNLTQRVSILSSTEETELCGCVRVWVAIVRSQGYIRRDPPTREDTCKNEIDVASFMPQRVREDVPRRAARSIPEVRRHRADDENT